MAKSEFRNFFNHGVTEVNTAKQSTTVTSVRSYGNKVLWKNKRVDACRAEAARTQLSGLVLLGSPVQFRSGGWNLIHGDLCKVDAPLEEVLPEIGFPAEHVYSSTRCIHTLQGTTFQKGFETKIATTRSQDTI